MCPLPLYTGPTCGAECACFQWQPREWLQRVLVATELWRKTILMRVWKQMCCHSDKDHVDPDRSGTCEPMIVCVRHCADRSCGSLPLKAAGRSCAQHADRGLRPTDQEVCVPMTTSAQMGKWCSMVWGRVRLSPTN